jgi:hypothetical protein
MFYSASLKYAAFQNHQQIVLAPGKKYTVIGGPDFFGPSLCT